MTTQYPEGAGPDAGYFQGAVWVPTPSGAPGSTGTAGDSGPTLRLPAQATYSQVLKLGTKHDPMVPDAGKMNYAFMEGPDVGTFLVRRIVINAPDMIGFAVLVWATDKTLKQILSDMDGQNTFPDNNYFGFPLTGTPYGGMNENEANPPYAIAAGRNLVLTWRANKPLDGMVQGVYQDANLVRVEYDHVL